jgi:hypothetical protein
MPVSRHSFCKLNKLRQVIPAIAAIRKLKNSADEHGKEDCRKRKREARNFLFFEPCVSSVTIAGPE